jgi:probable F420-dependent oxidoreductase
MLGLSGERTEGAHSYFVTPEHTAHAREILGTEPLLAPEQAVLLEKDPVKAREIARRYTNTYLSQPNYANNIKTLGFAEEDLVDGGTDAFVDALVAWGDVDTVVSRVQAHLDAGADHVAVQALSPVKRGMPDDQWRALAQPLASLSQRG